MQSSRGANRSQLRNTAAFLVLSLGAVLLALVSGSVLLHALYAFPWRPGALVALSVVAVIGFSCAQYIAPGAKWATFREGLVWSLFLTALVAFCLVLLRLPRTLTWPELLVLFISAPFVAFLVVYSWRHRRRQLVG